MAAPAASSRVAPRGAASGSPVAARRDGADAVPPLPEPVLPEPLPAHLHFHLDEAGNKVACDESICRPVARPTTPLFPPFR